MSREQLSHALRDLLPRLWIFALRVAGNPRDAEVLLRRACLRVFGLAQGPGPTLSVPGWMYSVIYHVWLDDMRYDGAAGEQPDATGLDDMPDAAALPGAAAMQALAGAPSHDEVIDAVSHLADTPRISMVLVAIEGFSYEEAAQILGISAGSVASNVVQARMMIGARLRKDARAGTPATH
ncbi:RNA polymerase sigma factor [Burkholderia gladioli]|uniref:RNA polymerase sigma factor n=1 Tax=Burkholderia gladioli TaxID=28095 RepID=UPI000F80ACE3|nr:RNA polymerase sigma factor [Burkholderia gladioli]URV27402.1 RNA polymerase sigma factor [Burkholderia gladioli]